MMKDIIVDVKMHFPSLYKCLGNCDYISSESRGYLGKESFSSLYNFSYIDFYKEFDKLDEIYNNLYFIHHFVDTNTPQTRWMDDYQISNLSENGDGLEVSIILEIYNKIKDKVKGKIILFCTSDHPKLDLDETGEFSFVEKYGIKYDFLFKKEYNSKAKYSPKTIPCPFYVMGSPDVLWLVNENKINNNKISDKVFWSGYGEDSIYDYQLVNSERKKYIKNFSKIYQYPYSGSDRGGLRDSNYIIEMSKYKYAIYLNGWATFTRRFFEILSTDTLMFFQKSSIVFPMGSDEFLDPLCVFSSVDELESNYEKINSSETLYNQCKKIQKEFVQKYYSYEYVGKYINLNIAD